MDRPQGAPSHICLPHVKGSMLDSQQPPTESELVNSGGTDLEELVDEPEEGQVPDDEDKVFTSLRQKASVERCAQQGGPAMVRMRSPPHGPGNEASLGRGWAEFRVEQPLPNG